MRIGIISGVLGLTVVLPAHAQKSDSIKSLLLPDVVVTESYQQRQAKKSALAVDVVDQDFLRKHFTGNFMQAMENIPGVANNGYRFRLLQTDDPRNGIQPDCCTRKRNQAGRTTMGSRPRTGTGCFQYRNCQCPERSFFTTIWQ